MRYMSVCSGVEAASLAWQGLGWEPVAFSEIEPFPCAVLAARFPDVPNLGDMTKIKGEEDGTIANGLCRIEGGIDLLVGGTPCQDVSVAGKRAGLVEGERSSLAFSYIRLARQTRARWIVWENVPGVLTAGSGRDFAAFVGQLAGWDVPVPADGWGNGGIIQNQRGGYGLAYRVLDAQYTRVPGFPGAIPQRRRRVFLVGYRGWPDGSPLDWENSAAVLFDGEGLQGNPPTRRKQEEDTAGHTAEGTDRTGRDDGITGGGYEEPADGGQADRRGTPGSGGSGLGISEEPVAYTNTAKDVHGVVTDTHGAYEGKTIHGKDVSNTIIAGLSRQVGTTQDAACVFAKEAISRLTVRRLTPVETERLMGFPDNWTRIPWRGRPAEKCPDAPRYKACGNSMCVNCMEWIGERIEKVERALQEERR